MKPSTSPLFADGHRKSIVGCIGAAVFFLAASGMLVGGNKGGRWC